MPNTTPAVNPKGRALHTLTPFINVNGAAKFMDFLKKAFKAEEIARSPDANGKLLHAQARIGDSDLMFSDYFPEMGMKPFSEGHWPLALHLYVPDADAVFASAQAAGCQVVLPLADQFWGDRYGHVKDPFGFIWAIATHKEDPTPEQMRERMAKQFSKAK